ncbi:MAG: nucleotidyl transferase AbiEii/AbiGii toxin family protein [Ilumatobacteraceae bacterium]
MTYDSPRALRIALEHRLLQRSTETGVSLDRLRRRVVFERVVGRLSSAEPGTWVVKGGMALEVRLRDAARLTKDLDLGLRDVEVTAGSLHERLIDVLALDPAGDRFVFAVGVPEGMAEGAQHVSWRARVEARLADTTFGSIQLDIAPRPYELTDTDHVELPSLLAFAGVPASVVEIIDIHRHAAEKLHAMTRDFGDRENSRLRDLVDLVLMLEHEMLTSSLLAARTTAVWAEREQSNPPRDLPPLPESWANRYGPLTEQLDIDTRSYPSAVTIVADLWRAMYPNEEN